MGEGSPGTAQSVRPPGDRLDSWKEIAAYLNRDVTTVQRWEKREGMPVHRHLHDRIGSVHASRADLDAWALSRNLPATPATPEPEIPATILPATKPNPRTTWIVLYVTLALIVAALAGAWQWRRVNARPQPAAAPLMFAILPFE